MILQKKSGQSLIEILVAIGVGVIMLVGAVTALTPAIKSLTDISRTQGSASSAKELLDNLRIFTETNWHNIDTLSTSEKYFLNTGTSTFTVATGTETVISDGVTSGLVGYWKFDETTGDNFQDHSGNLLNAINSGTLFTTSSYAGSARNFNPGSSMSVANNNILNFGTSSFSVSMWGNYRDFTYPKTWFMLKKSATCYLSGNPGWDIGHGYSPDGITICYTDGVSGVSITTIAFDAGYKPTDLRNKWANLVVVFDKAASRVKFYVNGVKQSGEYDISAVTGSVDNSADLLLGTMYGWQTDGILDEIRIYNRSLAPAEINAIYRANLFTRNFQVSNVYRDGNDFDKIITSSGSSPNPKLDPSTKKITIEYGWPGAQLKTFSAYLTRYKNKSFVQTSWQGGANSTYTSTTANWFTTSTGVSYSTSSGIRIQGL